MNHVRKRGLFLIEMLFTIIPILLMLLIFFYDLRIFEINRENVNNLLLQKKLFLISEYIVKTKAVRKNGFIHINWIDEDSLNNLNLIMLKQHLGLNKLYVGFSRKYDVCIYRLVVYGNDKKIKKLFVCGE